MTSVEPSGLTSVFSGLISALTPLASWTIVRSFPLEMMPLAPSTPGLPSPLPPPPPPPEAQESPPPSLMAAEAAKVGYVATVAEEVAGLVAMGAAASVQHRDRLAGWHPADRNDHRQAMMRKLMVVLEERGEKKEKKQKTTHRCLFLHPPNTAALLKMEAVVVVMVVGIVVVIVMIVVEMVMMKVK